MNNALIKDYIGSNPLKVVKKLDLEAMRLEYDKIVQCQKRTEVTPEEQVRAYLLTKPANELGYSPDRIEIEHGYTAGRHHTITSRIDVIVRDTKDNAFLFIEVKNQEEYETINKDSVIEEQLFKLAALEKAKGRDVKHLVLYITNGSTGKISDECIIIDYSKYSTYTEWEAHVKFMTITATPPDTVWSPPMDVAT